MTLPLFAYTEAEVGSDVSFPPSVAVLEASHLIHLDDQSSVFTPRELLLVYGGRKCLAAFSPGL